MFGSQEGTVDQELFIQSLIEESTINPEPIIKYLKPDHFSDLNCRLIYAKLCNLYDDLKLFPTRTILWNYMLKTLTTDIDYTTLERIVHTSPKPSEHKYYMDNAKNWTRNQIYRAYFNDNSVQAVGRGDYSFKASLDEELANLDKSDNDQLGFRPMLDILAENPQHEWQIEDIMVKGQPFILSGRKKSMKTAILVDMAVSLVTGTKFLGHFNVPKAIKVGFFSGETGSEAISDRVKKILAAKGLAQDDLRMKNLFMSFKAPKLCSESVLASIKSFVATNELEVLIIDPLYLSLLGGATKSKSSGILADMGPVYAAIGEACQPATPLLACHDKKSASNEMDLDNMTGSGPAEYARQSLLVAREGRYVDPSDNVIQCQSHGYNRGLQFVLEIDENIWHVKVTTYEEVQRSKAKEKKAAEKQKHSQEMTELADVVFALGNCSQREIMTKTGWNGSKVGRIVESCLEHVLIIELAPKSPENPSAWTRYKPAPR